jgi:tripartite-type tricarboxylate transporter receptor subunit TctC
MTTRRSFTKALALSPVMVSGFPGAFAQSPYPSKSIQMVVGFPVGQSSDIGARVIAKAMSDELKQTIFVDNKPGAATIIAHQFLKAAPADGYTIAFSSTAPLAINPTLYKKLAYDPQTDFDPIILLNFSPMFLVTSKDTPVNNLKEMLSYAKANKDTVAYGSGGSGLTNHITMELLKKEAGIEMLHVPYKGAPPMLADLMGGRVQFAFEVVSAVMPMIQAGNVKVLGVASLERTPAAPDVPTLHEQGLTGFESGTWGVLLAPKGTPKAIVDQLNAAANKGLKTREATEYYARNGATPKGGTAQDCAAFMKAEREKWAPVIIASGAQVD